MRHIIFFILLCMFTNNSYGVQEPYEDDLNKFKTTPLISKKFKDTEAIIKGEKAALTICTTPLPNSYFHHVAIVFEIKHPTKNEINLFTVHFGGDGYSPSEGRPDWYDARETLKKLCGGIETDSFNNAQKIVEPVYTRAITFIVKKTEADNAIKNIKNDKNLTYSFFGGIRKNSYNCCTYANKILKDAGINTNFDSSYHIKCSSSLIKCCEYYITTNDQKKLTDFSDSCMNEGKNQKNIKKDSWEKRDIKKDESSRRTTKVLGNLDANRNKSNIKNQRELKPSETPRFAPWSGVARFSSHY